MENLTSTTSRMPAAWVPRETQGSVGRITTPLSARSRHVRQHYQRWVILYHPPARSQTDGEREILDSVRNILLRQPGIEFACVFGSVAAQEPIAPRRRLTLNGEIGTATGRPVDLVDLHTAGPLLLTRALTRGKRIVKRDSAVLARLMVKMWYLNADLMPLLRMIQDPRRKRFLHG